MAKAAFGQTELVVNGGFESNTTAPWQISGTVSNVLFSQGAHAGSHCLRLGAGNGVSQSVYQTITFPTNLIDAAFGFYYNITSTDPTGTADSWLRVYVTDTNATPNTLAYIGQASNLATTGGYTHATTNLVTYSGQTSFSSYAGRSVRIYYIVDADYFFGVFTQFYLDDVSMVIGTTADLAVNNNFTNRTPITVSGSTMTAKTTYATLETNELSHAGNTGGHSVWWSWTSPGAGIASINDTSSDFHTVLAVYTGDSLTNLTRVASSLGTTNANGGTTTKVSFKAYPGVRYAIALDGYNSASGNAAINFSFAPDTTLPKVAITSPAVGATVTNASVTVKGSASDNLAVAAVEYRLENADGTNDYAFATGTNTWSGIVTNLMPGANTVRAMALDTSSNLSTSVTRTFNFAVPTPLSLTVAPGGTVTGATNGQRLNVNYLYHLTAHPKPGFAFTGWTGDIVTNSATLAFRMITNLSLTANFVDVARPVVTFVHPSAGFRVSNAVYTASGTAKDNLSLASVWYQLNGLPWTLGTTTNDWANWAATNLVLQVGTNLLSAYAVDTTGNCSLTNRVKFIYVLSAPLTLGTNGRGSILPAYAGRLLQISNTYALTAIPAVGFKFVNWTGSQPTNSPTVRFVMASNLTFIANFADNARPNLNITAPVLNQRWSNAVFTAKGKATDNVGVAGVYYRLNGAEWLPAGSTNGYTNWIADALLLQPGTNFFSAYAVDAAGNSSRTNSAQFLYILSAPLTVTVDGSGSLTPNLGGRLLQISNNYSMTAVPAQGFAFDFWSSEGITNGHSPIRFTMYSNLTIYAHFKDVKSPLNVISFPAVNQRWSNSVITVAGKASDNVGVAGVWYQLNGGGWNSAQSTNQFTNWNTLSLSLTEGTNLAQTFALDAAGNSSLTNSVKFRYVVPPSSDWAPNSIAGRRVQVAPATGSPATVAFSVNTFSQTDTNSADDSGIGNYQYSKASTNTAQLQIQFTQPPSMTNDHATILLVFTNSLGGTFTNQDTGNIGAFGLTTASALLPSAWSGHKITARSATSGGAVVSLSRATFSITATGSSSPQTGTYTVTAASPSSAMLVASYTNSASLGLTSYLQLTFTAQSAGNYEFHTFDSHGVAVGSDTDAGSFTWQ